MMTWPGAEAPTRSTLNRPAAPTPTYPIPFPLPMRTRALPVMVTEATAAMEAKAHE